MKAKTIKTLLPAMNYTGHISIRRKIFGGSDCIYVGGGKPKEIIERYGGYQVERMDVIDNVLIIYVY